MTISADERHEAAKRLRMELKLLDVCDAYDFVGTLANSFKYVARKHPELSFGELIADLIDPYETGERCYMTNFNKSIPMPKDADGRDVSLRTKVMYDTNSKKLNITSFTFRCDAQNAYWKVFSPDVKSNNGMCDVDELYLTPPDSWDKLEQDELKNPCEYFGRIDGCGSTCCDGCPAEYGSCFETKSIDLVRRAKALAGVTKND